MEGVEGEVAIDIREPLLHSARGKLSVLRKESVASDKCTIFRVPALIRQRNKHLYEPQTVAIGPYGRRNNDPCLRAGEWLKWRYLQEFLSGRSIRNIDLIYVTVAKILELLRRNCNTRTSEGGVAEIQEEFHPRNCSTRTCDDGVAEIQEEFPPRNCSTRTSEDGVAEIQEEFPPRNCSTHTSEDGVAEIQEEFPPRNCSTRTSEDGVAEIQEEFPPRNCSTRTSEDGVAEIQEELPPRNCSTSTIEDYVADIQELLPEVQGCYFELVELNPVEFAEMLLLDGCFILEFLIRWRLGFGDSMFTSKWSLSLVHDDLLLLENQIPLRVLDKLFERLKSTLGSSIRYSMMDLLVDYLTHMSVESPNEETKSSKKGKKANCGTCWQLASHFWSPEQETKKPEEETKVPQKWEAENFHHLLHLYYKCYVTAPQTRSKLRTDPKDGDEKRFPRTIPSATELLDAGVTIKKKKKNENETHEKRLSAFLDVAFEDGVLEIPFLSVDPSTLPRFSNLLAFEQCLRCEPDEAYMTSYAIFMNCLIDKREDVAVLHKRGILENNLASDEELAVFFNQLSDYAYFDYEKHYLAELFRDVRNYCSSPWPKWRAKLVRDYFSNPWAFISLIAAAVLLILTILQTVYTIYPYYYPRN